MKIYLAIIHLIVLVFQLHKYSLPYNRILQLKET